MQNPIVRTFMHVTAAEQARADAVATADAIAAQATALAAARTSGDQAAIDAAQALLRRTLLSGAIDCAVHSMKDMPALLTKLQAFDRLAKS